MTVKCLLAAAMLGGVAGCLADGDAPAALVRYEGRIGEQTQGWQFLEAKAGTKVYVPFEGVYESKGGRMQSPVIPLDKPAGKPAYYSLAFKARTRGHCYWWVDLFDATGQWIPDINSAVYPDAADDNYSQMIYVQGHAAGIQLAFSSASGVAVSDIALRRVSRETAAAWCDDVYAQLPPLAFTAPADAMQRLPGTTAALKDGRPWKVVMLGDSIMNDSFNSVFQALVKRDFPRSNLDFVCSVRGSTGCWYYQNPTNFAAYVTRHQPDLLMIGGISNLNEDKDDIPNGMKKVGRVIDLARAIGCEVVLLSPPHSVDWRPFDAENPGADLPVATWSEATLDPGGARRLLWSPYERQARLSGIAFWNITAPTADYVARSRKPHGYFNRDTIHCNDRGKQIIGRVMREYFLTAK